LVVLSVFPPVVSDNSKWFCRHISQNVCPWNHKFSRPATEVAFTPRAELVTPDLEAFATMDEGEFKTRYGDTPLSRARAAGIRRNARTARAHRPR